LTNALKNTALVGTEGNSNILAGHSVKTLGDAGAAGAGLDRLGGSSSDRIRCQRVRNGCISGVHLSTAHCHGSAGNVVKAGQSSSTGVP
jgi:hypothetical protein